MPLAGPQDLSASSAESKVDGGVWSSAAIARHRGQLVGSQRCGAGNLARHLLNDKENDHVTVRELRGFTARDLQGALEEAHAFSLGTNCKQFLFSLSLNPPKDANASLDDLTRAADQAEAKLAGCVTAHLDVGAASGADKYRFSG